MLSIAFSTIVSADETKLENLRVDITTQIYDVNKELVKNVTDVDLTVFPNNNNVEKKSLNSSILTLLTSDRYTFRQTWKFSNKDGNLLFKGERKTNLTVENGYYNIGYEQSSKETAYLISSTYIYPKAKYCEALIEYYDGTKEYLAIDGTIGRPTTLKLEFTPQKDVKSIEFILNSNLLDFTDTTSNFVYWVHTGEQTTDNSFNLIVDTESVEAGLLSGIIGWIKNIYDTIVNLPSKIWEFISEGLKGLFVPSEEYLTQFKNDMDSMLSEKLGAIYQVVNILTESWDRIQANDNTNTIDFPEVTIPLPSDTDFTFGGQTVSIVPQGFEFLATAIKTVTGICCTILFVNGLKKRYDDIMGG